MNQDHAVGGLSATSATAMLAIVLANAPFNLPANAAGAWSGLLVLFVGAMSGLVQMWINARKPAPTVAPPANVAPPPAAPLAPQ